MKLPNGATAPIWTARSVSMYVLSTSAPTILSRTYPAHFGSPRACSLHHHRVRCLPFKHSLALTIQSCECVSLLCLFINLHISPATTRVSTVFYCQEDRLSINRIVAQQNLPWHGRQLGSNVRTSGSRLWSQRSIRVRVRAFPNSMVLYYITIINMSCIRTLPYPVAAHA